MGVPESVIDLGLPIVPEILTSNLRRSWSDRHYNMVFLVPHKITWVFLDPPFFLIGGPAGTVDTPYIHP